MLSPVLVAARAFLRDVLDGHMDADDPAHAVMKLNERIFRFATRHRREDLARRRVVRKRSDVRAAPPPVLPASAAGRTVSRPSAFAARIGGAGDTRANRRHALGLRGEVGHNLLGEDLPYANIIDSAPKIDPVRG